MRAPRRWWPYVAVAVVALLGVLGTLTIARVPDRSSAPRELATAQYGYPIWFVEAELAFSRSSGPNPAVTLNPWEYPTSTNPGRLLGSWFIVAALPLAVVWWYERRRGSSPPTRRKSNA